MGASTEMASLRSALAAAVGDECVREARAADAVGGVPASLVAEPTGPEAVARALAVCDEVGAVVVVRGGGSKLAWGTPPSRLDVVLTTRRLSRVVHHADGDMTVTVEAGCTLADLGVALGERRQRLALDPPFLERATVGGVIATADAGPLRWRFGTPRDHVLGVTLALTSGVVARSGGRVVKNVAGYDLPKLVTGSFGTLAVVVEATLRLYGVPRAVRSVTIEPGSTAELGELLALVSDSTLAAASVQVRAASGVLALDMKLEGIESSLEVEVARLSRLVAGRGSVADDDVWQAHERLAGGDGVVLGVGVLPSRVPLLVDEARAIAGTLGLAWEAVAQADGAVLVRFDGPLEALGRAVESLRRSDALEEGSVVLRRCPEAIATRVSVWGEPPDAIDLMRRVKARFDPRGTLAPGRFVGGL